MGLLCHNITYPILGENPEVLFHFLFLVRFRNKQLHPGVFFMHRSSFSNWDYYFILGYRKLIAPIHREILKIEQQDSIELDFGSS